MEFGPRAVKKHEWKKLLLNSGMCLWTTPAVSAVAPDRFRVQSQKCFPEISRHPVKVSIVALSSQEPSLVLLRLQTEAWQVERNIAEFGRVAGAQEFVFFDDKSHSFVKLDGAVIE